MGVGETLADALRDAGGFRADAALKRVTIHRILPVAERGPGVTVRGVVDVALTGMGAGERGRGDDPSGVRIPPVTLMDGDSVVVDTLPSLYNSYHVGIAGRVNKPGQFPWRAGMTLRDLVLLARGPQIGADLKEAEVARLPDDRTQGQLATTLRVPLDSTYLFERDSLGRYVGPPGLPFSASGAPEVGLKPYDNVLILAQPAFDFQRTLVAAGEVRYPGTYSLRSKRVRIS